MTTFNETEHEAIILNAIWGMINDMVNYEMFVKTELTADDVVLMLSTSTHMRLFNVLLVDFLSQPQPRRGGSVPFDLPQAPRNARQADLTHLFYLRQVCAAPKFGRDASVISDPLNGFSDWLEAEAVVRKVWLPSTRSWISVSAAFNSSKCAATSPSTIFLRLSKNVKRLRQVLEASGCTIHEGQVYLVLPEFYEWFHRNIFEYHYITIAEYLNNLRLGIFAYLQPEFNRAYHEVEPTLRYSFHIPIAITHSLAKEMYWELMNMVRVRPYMPGFEISQYVKMRY